MDVAYIRVSTVEQNEERQIEGMKNYKIEKWFTEKVSGKNANRPQLRAMIDFVREGDVVHVHDFSRLARNTKDLLDIVETLTAKGVTLVSNKEGIDTATPTGKLMLTMIGAIAEFERANLLERQREGIDIAMREHPERYQGGHKKMVDDFGVIYAAIKAGTMKKTEAADKLNVSRPTLDRMIRDYEAATE